MKENKKNRPCELCGSTFDDKKISLMNCHKRVCYECAMKIHNIMENCLENNVENDMLFETRKIYIANQKKTIDVIWEFRTDDYRKMEIGDEVVCIDEDASYAEEIGIIVDKSFVSKKIIKHEPEKWRVLTNREVNMSENFTDYIWRDEYLWILVQDEIFNDDPDYCVVCAWEKLDLLNNKPVKLGDKVKFFDKAEENRPFVGTVIEIGVFINTFSQMFERYEDLQMAETIDENSDEYKCICQLMKDCYGIEN